MIPRSIMGKCYRIDGGAVRSFGNLLSDAAMLACRFFKLLEIDLAAVFSKQIALLGSNADRRCLFCLAIGCADLSVAEGFIRTGLLPVPCSIWVAMKIK